MYIAGIMIIALELIMKQIVQQIINNKQQIIRMQSELTNFLKKQNLMLKQQNKQIKILLQLNRQALKISTKNTNGETHFPQLINLLFQENSKLHHKIQELTTQLENGMCKALISQQIAFASTEQQRYLTCQLKDKLVRMRKQLQNRQKRIIELAKQQTQKKTQHMINNPVRLIEIVDVTILTKKFKDQINELLNRVQQKRLQTMKYKDQKQELLKLNLILTKQINEYKILTSHQSTSSNDLGSNDLTKYLNYQKKIIEDQDDPESDQQQFYQQGSQNSSSAQEPAVVDDPQNKVEKMSKLEISKVPKLQMSKVKQIQDFIVNNINNEEKKKGVIKQQKYKKVQAQLILLRKKIGQIMLEKMQAEKQNVMLKKFIKQLQSRNELLCQNKKQNQNEDLNKTISFMNQIYNHQKKTQTLLDICRDVTLNQTLKKVVKGIIDLPWNQNIISFDI